MPSYPRERHEAGRPHERLATGRLLPGVKINTSATDFAPIQQLQFMKFKAVRWVLFGDVVSGEVGGQSAS
jgi:hypothetical protein